MKTPQVLYVLLLAGLVLGQSVEPAKEEEHDSKVEKTAEEDVGRSPLKTEGRSITETQEPTVMSSLTDVWSAFGDVAAVMYKIKLTPDTSEGRGSKMGRMAIPLIIGFKIAGAIVAAIAALKVLIFKTLAMSSLALLTSVAVAAKYIFDKAQHHSTHHTTPYYYAPHVQEVGWDSTYDVQSASSDAHGSDLQGHYSTQILQTADDNQTAYSYIPEVQASQSSPETWAPIQVGITQTTASTSSQPTQVAQRKILRGAPKYKTTLYKTVYKVSS